MATIPGCESRQRRRYQGRVRPWKLSNGFLGPEYLHSTMSAGCDILLSLDRLPDLQSWAPPHRVSSEFLGSQARFSRGNWHLSRGPILPPVNQLPQLSKAGNYHECDNLYVCGVVTRGCLLDRPDLQVGWRLPDGRDCWAFYGRASGGKQHGKSLYRVYGAELHDDRL